MPVIMCYGKRGFYFEGVDLETILDDMARWYNVNVFMNPALRKR